MSRPPHDPHLPTVPPAADDGREARELTSAENADLCAGCTRCCTYVTIEVDAPRAAWEYDQWIWALHHEGLEIYLERPEKWFLYLPLRCRQLDAAGRCAIHGRHPVLCREYDPRACERRYPLSDLRAWFHDAGELERWLERERPAHWRRLLAHRRAASAAPGAAPGFVPIERMLPAAAAAARPGRSRRAR